MDRFIHKSKKFYKNVFLFVGLTTLRTIVVNLIVWLIKLSDQTFQLLILITVEFKLILPELSNILNLELAYLVFRSKPIKIERANISRRLTPKN